MVPLFVRYVKLKYALVISYDGTLYSGWQIQPHSLSIQQTIERVLKQLLGYHCRIVGAGRTDAGVHALYQVAHFFTPQMLHPSSFISSINQMLPQNIQIIDMRLVPFEFHARFSVTKKIYRYYIETAPIMPPWQAHYFAHMPYLINYRLIQHAFPYLIGKRDFTAFGNTSKHTKDSPIKTLYAIHLQVLNSHAFYLEFIGSGFLYKMVRNLVATLIAIGTKQRSIETLPLILATQDRRTIGAPAPAQGLFLAHIEYDKPYFQTPT